MTLNLRRKGMVLLQTLVISVILSMIAVMVLKWVLARYMLAARNYRSTTTKIAASGYFHSQFPNWLAGAIPADVTYSVPKVVNGVSAPQCVRVRTLGAGMRTVTITSDQDFPAACPP
ncbi:MAG: hypothetical protein NDI60_11205 [Elusimicrobiales bacterium]|nr:hypothetical protein [Elusimicrobiales bacterium]